jgi:hypothetical protein
MSRHINSAPPFPPWIFEKKQLTFLPATRLFDDPSESATFVWPSEPAGERAGLRAAATAMLFYECSI